MRLHSAVVVKLPPHPLFYYLYVTVPLPSQLSPVFTHSPTSVKHGIPDFTIIPSAECGDCYEQKPCVQLPRFPLQSDALSCPHVWSGLLSRQTTGTRLTAEAGVGPSGLAMISPHVRMHSKTDSLGLASFLIALGVPHRKDDGRLAAFPLAHSPLVFPSHRLCAINVHGRCTTISLMLSSTSAAQHLLSSFSAAAFLDSSTGSARTCQCCVDTFAL